MKNEFSLQYGNFDIGRLYSFLKKIDSLFPIHLSKKIKLFELAKKYICYGECIGVKNSQHELIALIVGYNNNSNDRKAYISLLVVLPEYQGCGIASRLISKFEEDCRKKGMMEIEVFTHKTNSTAIRLYEHNGFMIDMSDESRPQDFKYLKEL